MGLDFSRIKQAQAKSQAKGGFEKKDYTKIYFKPAVGKQMVRVVPYKEDLSYPFIECELHSFNAFKKQIPTLRNFGEKDPIVEFRKSVFNGIDEDDKVLVKKFAPKVNKYVQVIVRGQEGLGVRLWELNKTNYEALLSILSEEEEFGNVIDLVEGRDIAVTGINDTFAKDGKSMSFVSVTMLPSGKTSPLSKDPAQVEEWLEKQHIPIEQYKKYTAEEIEKILEDYLSPEDVDAEDEEAAAPVPTPAAKAVAALKPKPALAKKVVEEVEVEEITAEDELSEAIPVVLPSDKKVPAKAAPKKVEVAASSFKAKVSSIFDDEED